MLNIHNLMSLAINVQLWKHKHSECQKSTHRLQLFLHSRYVLIFCENFWTIIFNFKSII